MDPKRENVTVYHFEDSLDTKKYDFSETIPIWIYKDNSNPLTMNIAAVL